MLIVKVMSGCDRPDDDARKSFQLFAEVKDVDFVRDDDDESQAIAVLRYGSNLSETVEVYGNVYVMNEAGRTISTFSV